MRTYDPGLDVELGRRAYALLDTEADAGTVRRFVNMLRIRIATWTSG